MYSLEIEQCAYDPIDHTIIDQINPLNGRLINSDRTLEEIKTVYPNAEIWDFDKAVMHYYESFKTEPIEITKNVFDERLKAIPPLLWVNHGKTESFKMTEFLAGSITGIYARIEDKYYYLADEVILLHDQIIDKIKRVNS